MVVQRRQAVMPLGGFLMLLGCLPLAGCSTRDSSSWENYNTLERLHGQLAIRYGEYLSLHETNVILNTTLNVRPLAEVDSERSHEPSSEWRRIDWPWLLDQIGETLNEGRPIAGNDVELGKGDITGFSPPVSGFSAGRAVRLSPSVYHGPASPP